MNRKRLRTNQTSTIIVFIVILLSTGLLHFVFPEQDVSVDEGRKLRHFPSLNVENARNGKQAALIEGWFSDQFPFRSSLIKAGRSWRKTAFPNLNKDGLQIIPINHDLTGEDEPDTPDETDPGVEPVEPPDVDPSNTEQPQPSGSGIPPQTTAPSDAPKPPPIDDGEVKTTKVGIVIMKDRAMERYYGNESKLKAYAERLNRLADGLPGGTQLYSLVVPTAIELFAPEAYHSGYSSQKDCIGIIRGALASNVRSVNAYDNLILNRDQYIYYRTDHHWTGLGAYYAYRAFCESAGWSPVPLANMEHYTLEGTYLGSLYRATKEAVLKNNPDTTEGWRPVVDSYKATAWDKAEMTSSYQIRLNDERIKGSNSYLHYSGGDRALLKIETSHSSGRKILIVKDSFGNAYVPYLANHYDEIYVVDPRYYVRSLKNLVSENGITDVLILNYMFGTSNATWLKGFDQIAK